MPLNINGVNMRTVLFTLYGLVVGIFYSLILKETFSFEIVTTTFISLITISLFSFMGWLISRRSEMTNIQRIIFLSLFPLLFFGTIVGIGFIAVTIVVILPFGAVHKMRREHQLFKNMSSKGRFITLDELRPRLNAGVGTFIEDTGHKGPYHIWWTEDDLFSLGMPVSTKEEIMAIMTGKVNEGFNYLCLTEYLSEETGKALLTPISVGYARSVKFSRMFPLMKIARIVRPFVPIK